MENNFIITEDILWDYADGLLEADLRQTVDQYLAQQPMQRARLNAILQEKQALASLPLDKPVAHFADKVMAAWAFEQRKTQVTAAPKPDWILWAIAAGFGLLLVAPLVFALVSGGDLTGDNFALPKFDWPMAVQKFDFSATLRSPVFQYGFYLALASLSLRLLEKILHYWQFLHNPSASDVA